jgi:hypothetical protein
MQQRPVSVMIFGILNIGFGLLGIISLLVSWVFVSHMNTAGNPILQQMQDNPSYAAWMKISMPLGGIAHVLLLVAGIGLLLLQNWARIVSIGYGIYAIIGCIVGGVVMLNVFGTIMSHNARSSSGIMMMAPMIGVMFGMVIGLVYPILLIIFMTRPKAVAAFSPAQPVA